MIADSYVAMQFWFKFSITARFHFIPTFNYTFLYTCISVSLLLQTSDIFLSLPVKKYGNRNERECFLHVSVHFYPKSSAIRTWTRNKCWSGKTSDTYGKHLRTKTSLSNHQLNQAPDIGHFLDCLTPISTWERSMRKANLPRSKANRPLPLI